LGAVIPFNSGVLTLSTSPLSTLGQALGFGTSTAALATTGASNAYPVFFDAPRAGTVTALTTEFVATASLTVTTTTITLTLYSAAAGSSTWTSTGLVSTIVIPTGLTLGQAVTGTVATGAVAITQGTKLALVMTTSSLASTAIGSVGAGITFV
jgi:hypothetical protein